MCTTRPEVSAVWSQHRGPHGDSPAHLEQLLSRAVHMELLCAALKLRRSAPTHRSSYGADGGAVDRSESVFPKPRSSRASVVVNKLRSRRLADSAAALNLDELLSILVLADSTPFHNPWHRVPHVWADSAPAAPVLNRENCLKSQDYKSRISTGKFTERAALKTCKQSGRG
uniref:Uncharacterized protein n=1 Tax=Knipowitschia caucasica TaxID=637954 RepID=A0AAV2KV71_KNICA